MYYTNLYVCQGAFVRENSCQCSALSYIIPLIFWGVLVFSGGWAALSGVRCPALSGALSAYKGPTAFQPLMSFKIPGKAACYAVFRRSEAKK